MTAWRSGRFAPLKLTLILILTATLVNPARLTVCDVREPEYSLDTVRATLQDSRTGPALDGLLSANTA